MLSDAAFERAPPQSLENVPLRVVRRQGGICLWLKVRDRAACDLSLRGLWKKWHPT